MLPDEPRVSSSGTSPSISHVHSPNPVRSNISPIHNFASSNSLAKQAVDVESPSQNFPSPIPTLTLPGTHTQSVTLTARRFDLNDPTLDTFPTLPMTQEP